jgi:hypothetical protein
MTRNPKREPGDEKSRTPLTGLGRSSAPGKRPGADQSKPHTKKVNAAGRGGGESKNPKGDPKKPR